MEEVNWRDNKYTHRCSNRSWSKLPAELLWEIGSRNDTALDTSRFRSVCKAWRTSLPKYYSHGLRSCAPLPLPRPPSMYLYMNYFPEEGCFILTENTIYAIQLDCICVDRGENYQLLDRCDQLDNSSFKFVVFEGVGRSNDNYCCYFPRKLHAGCFLDNFPLVLDMLNVNAFPIFKFYSLNHASHYNLLGSQGGGGGKGKVDRSMFKLNFEFLIDKVVPLYDRGGGDPCVVVVGVVALSREGLLSVLRLVGISPSLTPDPMGWRPISYRPIPDLEFFRFDDIAEYDGKMCILDCRGCAFFLTNCCDPEKLTPVASPPPPCSEAGYSMRWRKRLVLGQSGDLFLLLPCKHFVGEEWRARILVYKLRLLGITSQETKEPGEWVPVQSLGDQAFYVGRNISFSAPVSRIFCQGGRDADSLIITGLSFCPYNTRDFWDSLFRQFPLGRDFYRVYDYRDGGSLKPTRIICCPEIDYNPYCGFYKL